MRDVAFGFKHGAVSALLLLLTVCGGPGGAAPSVPALPLGTVIVSDEVFRAIATVQQTPEYPASSFKWKISGVAVAEVMTTREGHMDWVRVVQAPDALTAAAVYEALGAWEVQPIRGEDGMPRRIWAKLFYYFTIENGQGEVRSPGEILGESLDGLLR